MYFIISDDIHLISHNPENSQDQSFQNPSMIIVSYWLNLGTIEIMDFGLFLGICLFV